MSPLEFIEHIPQKLWPSLEHKNYALYVIWRELCHAIGSLALLGIAILINRWARIDVPVIMFVILMAWMTYQEFHLHPTKYGQALWKGILDWVAWALPFALYFALR